MSEENNEIREEELEEVAGGSGKNGSGKVKKTSKYCLDCMQLKKGARMNVPLYKVNGQLFCTYQYHVYEGASVDSPSHKDPAWVKKVIDKYGLPK